MASVDKAELKKILDAVAEGVSANDVLEQSSCFIFDEGEVASFNDAVSVSHPVEGPLEDIQGAVPATPLLKILDRMVGDSVDIKAKDGSLKIKAGRTSASIQMEQEIRLPIGKIDLPEDELFTPLPKDFCEKLQLCLFSASRDMTRAILTCVHAKGKVIESTDKFRVTRATLSKKVPEMVIPQSAIPAIRRIKPIRVALDTGWLHFENKIGCILSCRTYTEKYPNVSKFLKVDSQSDVDFPETLTDMIGRAEIFVDNDFDQDKYVEIKFTKNKIIVQGKGKSGNVEDTCKVPYKGKDISFMIHPQFLKDIASDLRTAHVGESMMKLEGEGFEHAIVLMHTT